MQTLHQPAMSNTACFYRDHRLMSELKSSHKTSEFADYGHVWQPSQPFSSPPDTFTPISQVKPYPTRLVGDDSHPYNSNLYNGYQHHSKQSYYINSSVNPPSSGVLQWQHSIPQQNSHIAPSQLFPNTMRDHTIDDSNNRFDMLLRNQHNTGYVLSNNWCQSPEDKESTFQPPVATKNICRLCGKNYARPSTLKTHMRIHSGERPFHCKVCDKSFSQAANLTAHLRVHSGEKPFSCSICNKTFSQSSSVTTHMRTHSGDRPYQCLICRKGFSDSSTLTKHTRIHSGEKPYRCRYCSMSFSQSGNLNRHMKVHEHQIKSDAPTSAMIKLISK